MPIEARNRSLPDWFTRIRTRQTVLPRFQRFEAWGYGYVTQIFNTILQELPIGSLLVLEVNHDKQPFEWRPLKGAPDEGERVTEHLLDGQQRLTALWRGLHNNYEDRTHFLNLTADEETGMACYVSSLARWRKEGEAEDRPLWANNPKEQWARKMVPLDLCAPDSNTQQRLRDWVKTAIADQDERDAVYDEVLAIRQKFTSFNIPWLSLPVTTDKETALDVFLKMNTSVAPLSTYDIVVAQVEAALDRSLHDLVAETKEACPAIIAYYRPEDLALYASALLQDRPPTNSTYMDKTFAIKLLENWDIFLKGAKDTVNFLEQERIFDSPRLPSDVVVPVLVALWGLAPEGLDAEGRARMILRKYLWRAFFSDRYERSTNSRALVDFSELKPLVTQSGASSPVVFDEDLHRLPRPEELISAGWPVRKDRTARAILALALKEGGLDLADGSTVTRENLGKREYHHLFPIARLKEAGREDDTIFRSLNCALVTWRTNRNISAKKPENYLGERRDGNELGEAEVQARLASHLIPYDEMVSGDYDAFLEERAAMIHDRMMSLCSGGGS